jgi:hypothetical protein
MRVVSKIMQFWQRTNELDNLPTGIIAFRLLQKSRNGCLLVVSHPSKINLYWILEIEILCYNVSTYENRKLNRKR